jgi:radical SAM protein with 4Fe4S-binding SPASM domain
MKIGRHISNGLGYVSALTGFIAKSPHAYGGPVAVAIEPGNVCNLKCPLCAAGAEKLNRPKGFMRLGNFQKVIDSLPASVVDLYLWGQGEPFMVPDFTEMIRYAVSKGYRTIVSTNGHFLSDADSIVSSGLDTLIISIDGADKESYEYYRIGGDFGTVIDGIRAVSSSVRRHGSGPRIILQCLLTQKNDSDLRSVESLACEIGADSVEFKTLQAGFIEDGELFLPDNSKHTRYYVDGEGTMKTDRVWYLRDRCLRLYYSLQIDWQGNVLPCCFDKDSENIMGSALNEPVSEIWNGDKYRSFRRLLNKKGRVLPMCRDCTEGLKRLTIKKTKIT